MTVDRIEPLLRFIGRNFVRGVAISLPVALTLWVAWQAVAWVDGWLGIAMPGVGLLVVLVAITIIGALATNVVTRAALATLDQIFERLPLFRLLYTAAKDLMGAFVGNKRRFNRAVRVQPDPKLDLWFLGFVTADDVTRLGLTGHVAVYLPQSYNIAGNLVLVPSDRVVHIEGDSSEVMSFIVSGGVTGGGGTSPMIDQRSSIIDRPTVPPR